MSEDIGGFLHLPKNIPKKLPLTILNYMHPLHGNDKICGWI